jgi:hypothetical protein
MVSKEEFEERL